MPDLPTDTALLLGRMEGKLDALINQTSALNKEIKEHDERISSLEKWRSYILGAALVIGVGLSKLWDLVAK